MKNAILSLLVTTAIAVLVLWISVPMTSSNLLIICAVVISMMVVSFLIMRDALSISARQLQTLERKIEATKAQLSYAEKKLGEVNTLDDLTGCYNRRHFLELVQHHRGMAERGQYTFTVCATELDRFKDLTDHYGSAKSDELLRLTGSIVKSALREIDSVARIEGAQFGIILAGASEQESVTILTRVNALINQIHVSENDPIELTASAGVAEYCDAGEDDDLYDRAVKALKFAVVQGRNRVAAHIHAVGK
jgi:diguanylate cyclase (GGDEF)-like protein